MLGSELVKHSQASNVNHPVCISGQLFIASLSKWYFHYRLCQDDEHLCPWTALDQGQQLPQQTHSGPCTSHPTGTAEPFAVLCLAEAPLRVPVSWDHSAAFPQLRHCCCSVGCALLEQHPSYCQSASAAPSPAELELPASREQHRQSGTAGMGIEKNANKNADKFKVKP